MLQGRHKHHFTCIFEFFVESIILNWEKIKEFLLYLNLANQQSYQCIWISILKNQYLYLVLCSWSNILVCQYNIWVPFKIVLADIYNGLIHMWTKLILFIIYTFWSVCGPNRRKEKLLSTSQIYRVIKFVDKSLYHIRCKQSEVYTY